MPQTNTNPNQKLTKGAVRTTGAPQGAPRAAGNTPGQPRKARPTSSLEIELAKRIRASAERYHADIDARVRSQAHFILLQTRTAIQKEIKELQELREYQHQLKEELENTLLELRALKKAAQSELLVIRKCTAAAHIKTLYPNNGKRKKAQMPDVSKAVAKILATAD